MRILLLALLLSNCLLINAQQDDIEITLSIDPSCGFDSIIFQSMVSNEVNILQTKSEKHRLNIVTPVDWVLLYATGNSNTAFADKVSVKEYLHVSIDSKKGCSNFIIEGKGNELSEEFTAYKQLTNEEKQQQLLPLIQKHANSITINDYLYHYITGDFKQDSLSKKIIEILEENTSPIFNHILVKPLINNIKSTISNEKVTFRWPDTNAIKYTTEQADKAASDYDYTVIDFWFSTCAPCLKEHKIIKEEMASDRFPKNLKFIALSIDSNEAAWRSYLAKNPAPWDNYLLKRSSSLPTAEYGIVFYPTYLLLDKDGTIIHRYNSYTQIKAKLEEIAD